MEHSNEDPVRIMIITDKIHQEMKNDIDRISNSFPVKKLDYTVFYLDHQENIDKNIHSIKVNGSRKDIIKMILEVDDDLSLLCILDLWGGNTFEDLTSLIERSIDEGDRFACAYIKPRKTGLGCWAIDRGIFSSMRSGEFPDIEMRMIELAIDKKLELWKICQD